MANRKTPELSLDGMKVSVIRSARKTVGLEIKPNGQNLLRAPLAMTEAQMRKFLNEKKDWLEKHLQIVRQKQEDRAEVPMQPRLTEAEIRSLADKALAELPPRVAYYAKIIGVTYGRITIRNQTSRWGSCSSKGNLNFNCLLMLAPPEIADYKIVHELCHRKEKNHSPAFWALVDSVMPDYKDKIKWINEHGGEIMRRMCG